jgi:hypothetical protein
VFSIMTPLFTGFFLILQSLLICSILRRATSVEADHRLDRFRPSLELNSKPNNKIVKLKAIRVGTIIRRTDYSGVNYIATARWWDFMIPPSRQRFKSLRPLLPEEFS